VTGDRTHPAIDDRAGATGVLDLGVLDGVRDYDELAEALGVDRDAARAYARGATEELVPATVEAPPTDVREQIVDYLFGEQTLRERTRLRSRLRHSARDRAWASQARLSLSLVAGIPLPTIPSGELEEQIDDAPPGIALDGSHVRSSGTVGWASRLGPWGRSLIALLAVALTVGMALLVTGGGGGHVASQHGGAGATAAGHVSFQTSSRLTLSPAGSQPGASGVGAVVRQNGNLTLLLQARGLRPNHGTYYAVWLYNSGIDAELLGLVSPRVGAAGTFSSGTALPDDAVRFHQLAVTLEATQQPARPGRLVMTSPLNVR
jgi:hypothetical protein